MVRTVKNSSTRISPKQQTVNKKLFWLATHCAYQVGIMYEIITHDNEVKINFSHLILFKQFDNCLMAQFIAKKRI